MKNQIPFLIILLICPVMAWTAPRTTVTIVGEEFHINGKPTYENREWKGHRIQGLLMNSRMVQGIFDDRNPATITNWAYPDTGRWDAERNTREFIEAMPAWRRAGLLCFTINLQGGSPQGYSSSQPWHNSAIESDGSLRADDLARLERILVRADELGMAVILGYFYFGQDQRLKDETAIRRATEEATRWILDHNWRHVLVEINNECNVRYRCISNLLVILLDYQIPTVAEFGRGHGNRVTRAPDIGDGAGVVERLD